MDLTTVTSFRAATHRGDLELAPGETLLGGGTWLFSEPQPLTAGLVDLTTLGWPPCERLPDGGLRIAGTCTVEALLAHVAAAHDGIASLVEAAAAALLMSSKVQHSATVGGNLALALPAGAMISLTAGLGAEVVVWTPDGGERREPVTHLVRGAGLTSLAPGEVIRAVDVPVGALSARTAFRRASLAPYGRSSAVVVGRIVDTRPVLVVTASTARPVVLEQPTGDLESQLDAVDCWYDDAHGAPDWRRAVTGHLAAEVLAELAS